MQQRRREFIPALLGLHLAASLGLVWPIYVLPDAHWVELIFISFCLSQPALIACWSALGRTWWPIRWSATVVSMATYSALLMLVEGPSPSWELWQMMACIVVPEIAAAALLCLAARGMGLRVVELNVPTFGDGTAATLAQRDRLQFSLRQLLLYPLVVAGFIAAVRAMGPLTEAYDHLVTLGVAGGVLHFAVLLLMLTNLRWEWRLAVLACVLGTFGATYLVTDRIEFVWLLAGAGVVGTLTLLTLRFCGYRLVVQHPRLTSDAAS